MASAFFVALFTIVAPSKVRRHDGTPLARYPHEGLWHELKRQRLLLQDWRLLAMFVPMFASEVPIIVLSSLNCKCTESFPIATKALMGRYSALFQHPDSILEFRNVQLDADCGCDLDWTHAG